MIGTGSRSTAFKSVATSPLPLGTSPDNPQAVEGVLLFMKVFCVLLAVASFIGLTYCMFLAFEEDES